MKRYKYRIDHSNEFEGLSVNELNAHGAEGWELFHIETNKTYEQPLFRVYYFRKEKHDS